MVYKSLYIQIDVRDETDWHLIMDSYMMQLSEFPKLFWPL